MLNKERVNNAGSVLMLLDGCLPLSRRKLDSPLTLIYDVPPILLGIRTWNPVFRFRTPWIANVRCAR